MAVSEGGYVGRHRPRKATKGAGRQRPPLRVQQRRAQTRRVVRTYNTGSVTPGVPQARRAVQKQHRTTKRVAKVLPGVRPVANARYQAYMQALWHRTGHAYSHGRQPQSVFVRKDSPRALAWVIQRPGNRGHRNVYFTPELPISHLLSDKGDRQVAGYVPLHEWSHVYQSAPREAKDLQDNEAAADEFATALAMRLGIPPTPSLEYVPYRQRLLRSKAGRSYAKRGQFR